MWVTRQAVGEGWLGDLQVRSRVVGDVWERKQVLGDEQEVMG